MIAGEVFFARGEGGEIFEFTVPADGTVAREILEEKLAKGTLVPVPAASWVDRPDGSRYLVAADPADDEPGDGTPPAAPPSKDELIARATELGIEAKGNWGVARLTEAIAAAEAAQQPAAADGAPAGDGAPASAQAD